MFSILKLLHSALVFIGFWANCRRIFATNESSYWSQFLGYNISLKLYTYNLNTVLLMSSVG